MNEKNDHNHENMVRTIESVPAWMIKEDAAKNVKDIILNAARKSFLYKRYHSVLKQEDQYWGQVAHELLSKREIPRWVDFRRHIVQYTKFGKESWIELYNILFHKYLQHLLFTIHKCKGSILELGCGCGWLSLELARLGKNVVGIDASESSITLARFFYDHRNLDTDDLFPTLFDLPSKSPEEQGVVRYEVQDLNSLKIPEESYSAVVAWESLHHIYNLEGLADQVKYGLKRDGLFIIHDTINEDVLGRSLHKFLTKPKVIKLISRLHNNYDTPVPEQTQNALFNLFKRNFEAFNIEKQELVSPFEAVSGIEMINVFNKYFDIVYKSTHHHYLTEEGAFNIIHVWTEHLGFAPSKKFIMSVFSIIKKCDDFLIKLTKVKPKHVYLVLKPKTPTTFRIPFSIREKTEQHLGKKLTQEEWSSFLLEACSNIQKTIGIDMEGSKALDVFSVAETFQGCLAPADKLANLMLLSGWHLGAKDYRWTNGNAELFFYFPKDSKKLIIEMLVAPNSSPWNPQEVEFSIRGKGIGKLQITRPGWQTHEINLTYIPKSVVILSIKSNTFIPKELGQSDDSRVLGIGIKFIKTKT